MSFLEPTILDNPLKELLIIFQLAQQFLFVIFLLSYPLVFFIDKLNKPGT